MPTRYYNDVRRLSRFPLTMEDRSVSRWHQVRYFLALCETLNFARAAETCNVSQPALTRAVRKLEEELGGLLLRREHLLTHITDFGRLVRLHLEQMMAEAEAAKSTAMHFLQMDNAPINLGVMRAVGPIRFMSFLAEFRASHPGCGVTLTEGVPGHLAELLLDGKLDLAVMAQPEPFTDRIEIRSLSASGSASRSRWVIASGRRTGSASPMSPGRLILGESIANTRTT
jgi:DNA-binding transcriptional LysR family regulator